MTENPRLEKIEEQVKGLSSFQNGALEEIIKGMYQGKPLLGHQGLLTKLIKDLTQIALQGEITAYLQENSLEEGGNRRNGTSIKKVRSGSGTFDLEVYSFNLKNWQQCFCKTFGAHVLLTAAAPRFTDFLLFSKLNEYRCILP